MIPEFEPVVKGIKTLLEEWEVRMKELPEDVIGERRNNQGRTIRQILGHLADSASNNTHRIVHLQYQASPLIFPNYATHGNNDRWISIQDYQHEDWHTLVNHWKYSNLHLAHVIGNIDPGMLERQWQSGDDRLISLKAMVLDYLRHLELHLEEIEELVNAGL